MIKKSNQQWLNFGVDTLIERIPYPSLGKDAEYFAFMPGENNRGPLMRVDSKPTGDKLFSVMADFSFLLANQFNTLLINEF